MSKIRVRLLGGFEVWAGDRQVGSFESQKVRALLAYLVCHRRRSFSRDHLAGLLWPERGPEAARQALDEAVSALRSALGEGGASLIRTTDLEIGLDSEADFWLDVDLEEEPSGPLVPLAGRGEGYEKLWEAWGRVLQGSMCFTLVTGESGVGKTRLVKSFMDVSTSTRRAIVLKGRCYELAPLVPYQPILEILRNAFSEEVELAEQSLATASGEVLEDLVRLVPDLRQDLPAPALLTGAEGRRRLFGSVARFIEGLCGGGDPLILFLDDLHLADRDTLDLLMFLTARLQGPVWILAICLPDELDPDHPLEQIVRYGESKGRATRLEIGRLDSAALEEIAESLVGEAQRAELARFLMERSEGLPLAMTEIINYLWDEGLLVSRGPGRWTLAGSLGAADLPEELDELIRLRIRRLPNSTKRLATLAAIMGQRFDIHLLQEAADEHAAVIEIGLEILLKRWLIRQFAHSWTSARRGSFEFSHKRIRGAVYRELNPLRRQAMHTQVAEGLERLRGGQDHEALAFHFAAAGLWEKSLPHLERAVERAMSVLAVDTARRYCDQAIETLGRLAAGARSEAQAARWRGERERMREIRERAAV